MGVYATYGANYIQIHWGDRDCCEHFKVGDKVYIDDGIYVDSYSDGGFILLAT